MPMTMTFSLYMKAGIFILIDSPPTFELIYFMIFEATERLIFLAVNFNII